MGMGIQFAQHRLELWDLSWDLKKNNFLGNGIRTPPSRPSYNWSRNKFFHVARQIEGFCISHFSPPLLSYGSLADSMLKLSFVLALL